MSKISISLLCVLAVLLGCGKRYPPPGAMSDEMEQAIAEENVTYIQRQFDNKLANPNDADPIDGMSGLAQAANQGRMNVVQLYVKDGADVNYVKGDSPVTNPLWQAQSFPEIYKYLEAHGAKPPASIQRTFILGVNAR